MLIDILPYVLGATISPVLLTVMVVLLAQPKKPLQQGLTFFVGGVLAAIPIGGLLFFAARAPGQAATPTTAADILHIVIGLLLGVLAIKAWKKPAKKAKKPTNKIRYARDFMLGIVMVGSDITSLIMFVPAGLVLQHAPMSTRIEGLGLLIIALTMAMWLPLIAVMLLGKRGRQLLNTANKVMTKHGQQITAIVVGAIALYELYKGISAL